MKTEIKSKEQFNKEVLVQSYTTPVVVDFWADWCMPCKMLMPVMEKIAAELDGKFVLAKVNVDENEGIAQEYEIMSIPAVKLFKNGKIIDEFSGANAAPFIMQWLANNNIKK